MAGGMSLPDDSMRRELFALHLPNPAQVQADNAVLTKLSRGLRGGDILNVCVNAIHAGSVGGLIFVQAENRLHAQKAVIVEITRKGS
jgi:hypothetical protein